MPEAIFELYFWRGRSMGAVVYVSFPSFPQGEGGLTGLLGSRVEGRLMVGSAVALGGIVHEGEGRQLQGQPQVLRLLATLAAQENKSL